MNLEELLKIRTEEVQALREENQFYRQRLERERAKSLELERRLVTVLEHPVMTAEEEHA
jgi:hypothetical protein